MKTLVAALLGLAVLLVGCTRTQPYQTTLGPRPDAYGKLPPSAPAADACKNKIECVAFVEFDDYGNLLNREQLLAAVRAAEETAHAHGTVLVYAHGWHNDAANTTRDVEDFNELVKRTAAADRVFRPGHPANGRVLGVYIGWRGDSIRAAGLTWLPSYALTFWDRKGAAQNVGASGGVYDLLSRLSEIRQANAKSRLLIQGHSFGGAMVYSALAQKLMDQIRRDGEGDPRKRTPFADLVLLLNPAFEAMRLRPQFDLARSQEYADDQPPRLVVVTTKADWATRYTFRIGRALGTIFDGYADEQSPAENKTAVGHYRQFTTHALAPPPEGRCVGELQTATIPKAKGKGEKSPGKETSVLSKINTFDYCIGPLRAYPSAKSLLITRCDKAGSCPVVDEDHYIARGKSSEGFVPVRLPIMNVYTTADVSTGHSDIRNPTLENFVLTLLTLAINEPGPDGESPSIDAFPLTPLLPVK